MGFFGVMGRILAGKPAFVSGEPAKGAPVASPELMPSVTPQAGPKQIPQLRLGRTENHIQNGRYELYVDIVNASPEQVFLDTISLLGTQREIDSALGPGQTRQYRIYEGRPLANPATGYAQIRYRKQRDGDYFMAYFEIRSWRESDGFFKVTEFRQVGPVKDI